MEIHDEIEDCSMSKMFLLPMTDICGKQEKDVGKNIHIDHQARSVMLRQLITV